MPNTILYAKEYHIDLPEGISPKNNIITTHTSEEALSVIDQKKDSIDGFILGMIMIQPGVSVEAVDKAYKMYHEPLSKIKHWGEKASVEDSLNQARTEVLENRYHDLLDLGGELVFAHLNMLNYVSKKPILFYTSVGNHILVRKDNEKKIDTAIIPLDGDIILNWFDRNFP